MSLSEKWVKDDLPLGDLQLLTTCRPSGVLRLTQSNYGIDQTTYFRNSVFGHLSWNPVAKKEMTNAIFKLEINGQSRGEFRLELSHDPLWESNQNNYTTGLHWGDATSVIQDHSLFGKTLTLYEATGESYDYLIKID
jgi:hypothetical protein